MVRGFENCPKNNITVVYMEEGVIGYNPNNNLEIGIDISFCIEVLSPGKMEIEELISESLSV